VTAAGSAYGMQSDDLRLPSPVAVRNWNSGRASTTVLLLHGATSSSRTWWQVAPQLNRLGYHVIAADLPGHGETPAGSRPLTPRAMAERLLGIAASPVDVLVGHSLGSLVAVEMLNQAPEVARALILDEPPGLHTVKWDTASDQLRTEQPLARRNPGLYAEELHRNLPVWQRNDCVIAAADLAACELEAVSDALAAISTGSSHTLLATLSLPTLIMLGPDSGGQYVFGGDYGSSLRGEERRLFIASIPRATTSILGIGHVLHRDAPEEWTSHATDFAHKVVGGPTA
jgi:pimeloyl-ACP methyl ester carboxylesterase